MLQLLIQATKLSWLYAETRESIASRNFGLQFSRKLYSAYKLNNILFISRIIVMISCGNEIETKFNLHSQQDGANGGKVRREQNQTIRSNFDIPFTTTSAIEALLEQDFSTTDFL